MDLINKEHVAFLKIGEDRCQISGFFDGGTCGEPDLRLHLTGTNMRERRFTKTGRTMEEEMPEGFLPFFCRLHIHQKMFFDLRLSDVFRKSPWSQGYFQRLGIGGYSIRLYNRLLSRLVSAERSGAGRTLDSHACILASEC